MFKRILVLLFTGIFIFGAGKFLTAQEEVASDAKESQAINVGNKICPVSGDKIDEKTKATYEYEGKVYNFCCPMCIEEFKKDPQKYIQKVGEELQVESKEESKHEEREMEMMRGMGTSHQDMHQGHHH